MVCCGVASLQWNSVIDVYAFVMVRVRSCELRMGCCVLVCWCVSLMCGWCCCVLVYGLHCCVSFGMICFAIGVGGVS